MKDKNQDIGWLILLFIASCFFGFLTALWFQFDDTMLYLITGSTLTLPAFIVLTFLYHRFAIRSHKEALRALIARGNYMKVLQSIDSDGKEMNTYWEWKLLALFHSGNILEFKKLYKNYMNEINEGTTLERYILSIVQDLLIACETDKKPVNFMKNALHNIYPYTKQIEYQLYHNIRLGLMEYYQPQKHLVKIYFDKFIQQADTISKPLLFYLYYLMTYTMSEGNHPQVAAYYQKTQSFIFDQDSLRLCNEVLRIRIERGKKGTGYENDMNRDYDNHRRMASSKQVSDDDMNRRFNYQPSFQRNSEQEETFAKRRHASQYQNEFDTLNATIQGGDSFQLYEENEFDQLPKRTRTENTFREENRREDIDPDLDPTWFIRKSLQDASNDSANTASFSRSQAMKEEPAIPRMQQRSNPMQQSPFMNNNQYQDITPQPSYMDVEQTPLTQRNHEEPSFINQRNYQENRMNYQQPVTAQMQNPMAQQSMANPAQRNTGQRAMGQQPMQRQAPIDTPFPQAVPPIAPIHATMAQPRNVDPRTLNMGMDTNAMIDDTRFDRFQTRADSPHIPIDETQAKVKVSLDESYEKKHRFSRKKNAQVQDPFAFEQSQSKQPQSNRKEQVGYPSDMKKEMVRPTTDNSNPYKGYIKHNLIIFFFILFDAIVITAAASSVIYNTFFNKYPIRSEIIPEILIVDGIVALLIAYATAAIHTGFTIMKPSIKKWNTIAKVLLSPILLLLFLFIGILCEVPYLIYAAIKSKSEK